MTPVIVYLIISLSFLIFQFCTPLDTITPTRSIKDGDFIISSGQSFALGFFSPGNSTRRYVGIWYHKVTQQTVVWVANRDSPLNDTSGVLSINAQGNLVLHQNNQTAPIWSTNSLVSLMNNSEAKLLDYGNLVLLQSDTQIVLWQSFDYPTDTLLPFMKLGLDRRTGFNRFLSSWKSKDDPGTGSCTSKIDPTGYPQLFLYKGLARWWRPGPWTGERWSGIPEMTRNYIFNFSFVNNDHEVSVVYAVTSPSVISRMTINESGVLKRYTWNDQNRQWINFWSDPKEECDYYQKCGPNSYCDPYDAVQFACKCLPGFEPRSPKEWYLRDGSGGCVRKHGVSTCRSGEGFVTVARVRVPDTSMALADMSMSTKVCEQECLGNCSCNAYTSADVRDGGSGCLAWYGDLVDTRTYSEGGQELYVRVDAVELGRGRKSHISFNATYLTDSTHGGELDESIGNRDSPFFSLGAIAAATNNFSADNKLGEGGFGPVYKGLLQNGSEIAVKRLSKYSGQGIEEFKNEVALIAKLQHRNLVRLLGCCIQDQEKMLIYEYLPNKSLDFFIFDEIKRSLLDWRKRFEIICGIARGILYLHQDSRLRIIHRDLKASNVLLDAEMNPKISDFGMARTFGGNQIAANTNRVVGTYGYMSPEYAMEGLFSTKSDVYSFGVLLLEIITGSKNSNYYHEPTSSNLVGRVWDLWKEGRAVEIVDPLLEESSYVHEILKCLQIGILCVQELPNERPTMSTVVFMLGNDTSLPSPKRPAFIFKRSYNSADPSTSTEGVNSVNEVTVTMMEAR
ncbi:G-type lectin S-receptor-like serine/threonine-protein kinase At1g11410 isoform X2 [Tripterygium wilfordii]|uniref:G-type lectin S-receptor-like serine/threonine-protein kinase At1g11410 isoform X2 n=1 Tax=Tripterygium wilfordii TaxID=458696 RepID=UPI0018F80E44|nr:G-type lectin S-receptor-like serine/threonine-protein kinase At1g11410 isoform X2 [Tripterygium wilfordii]